MSCHSCGLRGWIDRLATVGRGRHGRQARAAGGECRPAAGRNRGLGHMTRVLIFVVRYDYRSNFRHKLYEFLAYAPVAPYILHIVFFTIRAGQ